MGSETNKNQFSVRVVALWSNYHLCSRTLYYKFSILFDSILSELRRPLQALTFFSIVLDVGLMHPSRHHAAFIFSLEVVSAPLNGSINLLADQDWTIVLTKRYDLFWLHCVGGTSRYRLFIIDILSRRAFISAYDSAFPQIALVFKVRINFLS